MNETLPIKQVKFSGEISPSMYGDTTHPKYVSSMRLCLNWIPIPQGALVKRPGSKFIAPVKDASYAPRLVRFFFSDAQTFVLEFGNLYVRFYQQGKYVGNDGALHTYGDAYGGGYYEIVTPFTTTMLPYLKFAQVGDVVTITYGGQAAGAAAVAPQDLVHTSGAFTPWAINSTPLKLPAGVITAAFNLISQVPQWNPANLWNMGERCFTIDTGGSTVEWICIQGTATGAGQAPPATAALNTTSQSISGNLWWMPVIDLAHPASKSSLVYTAVVQGPDGATYESRPLIAAGETTAFAASRTVNTALGNDRRLAFGFGVVSVAAGYKVLYLNVYRAPDGGLFGWVASVLNDPTQLVGYPPLNTTGFWLDDGRAPDYTRQPPKGTDPFLINGADSYPSVVGYLDQRRLFAAPKLLPSSLILSKAGDLYNYEGSTTRLIPGADTDAMLVLLASEVLEQVRAFVPMRRGLILTSQGEWAIAGQGGGPVSRSSLDVKRQSAWGSSWLNPIIIGTGVLFNSAKSNMVRDLYPLYGLYADIWDGQDLSVIARHLLDLHTLSDWAFQSVPYPVVWAVREDGMLLSLTYQHAPASFGQQLAEGVVSWGQHSTGVGSDKFESVCVVPEPPDDAVYVGVKRLVNGVFVRNLERFSSPICAASPYAPGVSDVRYGQFLDACLQYDGHNDQIGFAATPALVDSVANPGSVNPADFAIGSQIFVNVAGGPFVAADAANPYGSAFVFDPENLLGLNVPLLDPDTGLATGKVVAASGRIVAFTNSTRVTLELDVALTAAQIAAWHAGATKWAIAKGQVTAAHLAGYQLESGDPALARGVTCLADGDVQAPAAWVAGVASLAIPAVVIQIGISYNSDAALLDAWHPSVELRNKFKEVIRMGFEIAGTRDVWGGKDFSNLSQLVERTVLDAYASMGLHTGYYELFVTGGFSKSGSAVMRHFQPLPAVVSSIVREMRLGDT